MEEIWAPVLGAEDYMVSDQGRILGRRGKVISGGRDYDGYVLVTIYSRSPKARTLKGHRMVYEAFRGKIPDGLMINHLNGIKDDNRLENLEVTTASGNQLHSYRVLGRVMKQTNPCYGSRSPHTKLTEDDVRIIRKRMSEGVSCYRLAKEWPISEQGLWRIKLRKTWAHID